MSYAGRHPFDWRILSSHYLIRDRWLKLRADVCRTVLCSAQTGKALNRKMIRLHLDFRFQIC